MVSRSARRVEILLPGLLLLAALIYYALYFRSGFELADEGSVALLSLRILQGERPFIDLTLGYNVLWFYPITGLFALIGPNFVAMKVWFFALAAVTALAGYFTVKKVTGSRWVALAAGLALVLLPGSPYKTYIPLIIVANMLCMSRLVLDSATTRRLAMNSAIGGAALGLGYLIRIDVAMLLHALWIVLILLHGIGREALARWAAAAAALFAAALLIHAPVAAVALSQGFAAPFFAQYSDTFGMFAGPVKDLAQIAPAPLPPPAATEATEPVAAGPPQVAIQLARPSGAVVVDAAKWEDRAFALLTYAPIASALLAGAGMLLPWRSFGMSRRLQLSAIFAVAPLAAYPQFLLFRPDAPHLSEFMPGCLVSLCVGAFAFATARVLSLRHLGSALLVLHAALYAAWAFEAKFTGTINARTKRNVLFEAENGVSVYLKRREAATYRRIAELVAAHSQPGEYVVCYPYFPGINFMTNRPTYEKFLYIDNLMRPKGWFAETVAEIDHYRPALIITRDWEIHGPGTEFSVWAADVKQHIAERYRHLETVGHFEIYARPDTLEDYNNARPRSPVSGSTGSM